MSSFTFIGLGLNDEKGITLEGLETAKQSNAVFAEFYTNPMPRLHIQNLESQIGKGIQIVKRQDLEDGGGQALLNAVRMGSVALLVPGDPMIATTHVSLRLALSKIGIKSRIIHAASVISAISGSTGLQSYKFGKSVTIPFDDPLPNSVQQTIQDNRERGLHTLLLLDVRSDLRDQLTIPVALRKLANANLEMQGYFAVGAARIGASDEEIRAGRIKTLINEKFGNPPHSIVVVGKRHFMETEGLKVFCGASDEDLVENP